MKTNIKALAEQMGTDDQRSLANRLELTIEADAKRHAAKNKKS